MFHTDSQSPHVIPEFFFFFVIPCYTFNTLGFTFKPTFKPLGFVVSVNALIGW